MKLDAGRQHKYRNIFTKKASQVQEKALSGLPNRGISLSDTLLYFICFPPSINSPRQPEPPDNPSLLCCVYVRRISATSIATRVAEELGCRLGHEVGYAIRCEHCISRETRIKYMTTGILLREAVWDTLLSKYSVVMLDEAHERTLETDLLLGLLKRVPSSFHIRYSSYFPLLQYLFPLRKS